MRADELRGRVLRSEQEHGTPPEQIARKYPDLWSCAEQVRAEIDRH